MYDSAYNHQMPCMDKHSRQMESASLVLGLVAVMGCTCLYLAIPCGALAVILASLSRGGAMDYGQRAQVGLVLGAVGLALTAIVYGVSFGIAYYQFGSIEGILEAYSDMMY